MTKGKASAERPPVPPTPAPPTEERGPEQPTFWKRYLPDIGIGAVVLAIVGALAYFIVYTAVPNQVKADVGNMFASKDGPMERIIKLEQDTRKIPELEKNQNDMNKQLIELNTKFEVYFDKTLDTQTAEQALGRAVNRATNSQDPLQRTAALNITGHILDKITSRRKVIDYKKANQLGLALLRRDYEGEEKLKLEAAVSKVARQRNLKLPAPPLPKDEEEKSKYIVGGERVLDATLYKDVTFVDCVIRYHDGWIGLENVRFINCTFEVSPENYGKKFYEELFKSEEPIPSVTLKTPSPLPNSPTSS